MALAGLRVDCVADLDPQPEPTLWEPASNIRQLRRRAVGPPEGGLEAYTWGRCQLQTVAGEAFAQLHTIGHFNDGVH